LTHIRCLIFNPDQVDPAVVPAVARSQKSRDGYGVSS
jgi:hypothetical protein